MIGKRKLVLVGTRFVGMSMAYAIICQGQTSGVKELVLIDIDKDKAIGEAMDLQHGLPTSASHAKIKAGDYSDCSDADIVVITAGLNQKPGQTRLELATENAKIMKDITTQIVASGFKGIIIVATNPVDIMTKVVQEVSGFDPRRVIGTGTALDTARLRYMLGEYFNVSDKNIHAYIMGEHGDSSFVSWDHVYMGGQRIKDVMIRQGRDMADLDKIYIEVRDAAYEIINRKRATYYGIGLGLAKIVRVIMNDTDEILTVSSYLGFQYGQHDIYVGVPTILNAEGAREIIELDLSEEYRNKLNSSCDILREYMSNIRNEL